MATTQKTEPPEDLHDSWVELHYQTNGQNSQADPVMPQTIYNGTLEKLLIEAQKESRTPSIANSKESSARGSPKSPHSPNNETAGGDTVTVDRDPGTDWIWDWSSRPEIQQSSDFGRFKHPRKSKLSIRNTRVMKAGIFRIENIPTLLLSHACTFFLGAAVMFMYIKKYCSWAVVTTSTID
ncbi:hypothetical protein ScPMuIL_001176 [Solemya velum]